MQIEELVWDAHGWVFKQTPHNIYPSAQLILVFGSVESIKQTLPIQLLQNIYPHAKIVGASTAGTIEAGRISEHSLVATVIAFDHARVETVVIDNLNDDILEQRSSELIQQLPTQGLKHIFVLAEGLKLNGSLLLNGLNHFSDKIPITGALAGDGWQFDHTFILAGGEAKECRAVAIGLYGESLQIHIGCGTGWEEFGAERVITKSEGNRVYEIDDKPALKLYEDYLGEYIQELPLSALRFPLNVRDPNSDKEVVRVMMGINEDKSILFGADIPEGSVVRLMKTNAQNLIEGSERVAKSLVYSTQSTSLAIAISCSARRSVLKQLVDEELSALEENLSSQTHICGFYSYGEIAPFSDSLTDCKLHNQTMTVTLICEDTNA
jgi:hypothetical protein